MSHAPLINLQFPANAFLMYDVMISVATFDLLPTDDMFPTMFKLPFDEDEPFNAKFDRMDIGSRFMVMNMGTMFILFSIYLLMFIVYPCVRFLRNDAKCARKILKRMRHMLFYNHIILFLQEGYLDILLAGTVNLSFLRSG